MPKLFRRPWHIALLCTVLACVWQWVLAAGYFQGHWSGLFVSSSYFPLSPPVREEGTFVRPNSVGFDGQFYHTMAHDPADLYGTDRFMDASHLRYSRILLPGLSYILGFGRWVDRAYWGLELTSVFAGVLCLAALAQSAGRSLWWGAAFTILPPVYMSLERGLVDLPLCALIAAAVLSAERANLKTCWLALAAAGLVREMGLVAIAAFAFFALRQGRLRESAYWALAAAPALAWIGYVVLFIPQTATVPLSFPYPLFGVIQGIAHPVGYPYATWENTVLRVSDAIAVGGVMLAYALGGWAGVRGRTLVAAAALAFAVFGAIASSTPILEYHDPYNYCRQNGALLLMLLIAAIQSGRWTLLLPLALLLPRAALAATSMTVQSLLNLLGSS